jgi:predicted DNA-binding protein with PD1-like motif
MKYCESSIGRIFVIRLEDGDRLPDSIDAFAMKNGVLRAFCIFLGGVGSGSTIVSGPEEEDTLPPHPMLRTLAGVHEIAGVGTVFPDKTGVPRLHGHAAFGRDTSASAGCIRPGIKTWKVIEVILCELLGECGTRIKDRETGFELLSPGE